MNVLFKICVVHSDRNSMMKFDFAILVKLKMKGALTIFKFGKCTSNYTDNMKYFLQSKDGLR